MPRAAWESRAEGNKLNCRASALHDPVRRRFLHSAKRPQSRPTNGNLCPAARNKPHHQNHGRSRHRWLRMADRADRRGPSCQLRLLFSALSFPTLPRHQARCTVDRVCEARSRFPCPGRHSCPELRSRVRPARNSWPVVRPDRP